ncbi:hypothetical protein FACS1894186_4270 [Alphaproteobacteria bacterium]|nr:hypothetical protein FACS1894186_4270 [Alphaproteobacteria bacterium]
MVDNISVGTIPNPYREWEFSLPPMSSLKIDYVSDNVAVMYCSVPGAMLITFGGQGGETTMEQGMRYKLSAPVPWVKVKNTAAAEITVRLALGIGDIQDNRLTVSGVVQVGNTDADPLKTVMPRYGYGAARQAFGAGGSITIPAGHYIIQNNSASAHVNLFAEAGFALTPYASAEVNSAAEFTAYGTAGQQITVVGMDA